MQRRLRFAAAATLVALVFTPLALAGGPATRGENAIWAHDVIYDVLATQNSFTDPPSHTVDKLYNFSMSGLMGQRSVSESAPGDTDYNGGRWWIQMVVFTPAGLAMYDPDGDGTANVELTNAEQVLHEAQMGRLEIHATSAYFSCPLLPTR